MATLLQQKYPAVQCKKLYLPRGCALSCVYGVVCIYIPIKHEETLVMVISKAQFCKD